MRMDGSVFGTCNCSISFAKPGAKNGRGEENQRLTTLITRENKGYEVWSEGFGSESEYRIPSYIAVPMT